MRIEKASPCKVNLLLNVLGKRPDGFHELETVMHPVPWCDELEITRGGAGIQLTCSDPAVPTDAGNLAHRAASAFFSAAQIQEGVRIHLEKKIPVAAGLGGGSSNAAITLLGCNELFGRPLAPEQLRALAAALGSDIPFFLQSQPALATGRGERIQALAPFAALAGRAWLLIHPGFGVATAWAYAQLARFPRVLNGQPGRARRLLAALEAADWKQIASALYNSLETPVLAKYPLLELYQEFLRANGAEATLMSGSGATTFALVENEDQARTLEDQLKGKFGPLWTAVVPVP